MVVIIVVGVLASVTGPMITSIVDQGRKSATKAKLDALKNALIAYQADVGRLPHTGKAQCSRFKNAYDANVLLGNDETTNVLSTDVDLYNGTVKNYSTKWKGPYMDSDPMDFMFDAWDRPILYVADGKNVFLWSKGPEDEDSDDDLETNAEKVYQMLSNKEKTTKSIMVSVRKFKKALK